MGDKPIGSVYSYVERAYFRLQAGDVLNRCLEEGSSDPMHEMAEGLILIGPQSLDALRESLQETSQRKNQAQDDLHQMLNELKRVLKSYGVLLPEVEEPKDVVEMTPFKLLGLMRQQGILEDKTQEACLMVLKESRDLMSNLVVHVGLLSEVEGYLQDWVWGLAYQSVRNAPEAPKPTDERGLH